MPHSSPYNGQPPSSPRSSSTRWSQGLPAGGGGASIVQAGTARGGPATSVRRRSGALYGEEG
eukprot:10624307-Alexandrium_andersonii.AAC.1